MEKVTEFLSVSLIDDINKLKNVNYGEWDELEHNDLTQIKLQIEPLELSHKWEQLKKKTNPYELVYTQESEDCPSSLSLLKPLSRSYFKMIEMIYISNFFDKLSKTGKLRSAHVAEGPGGFIEAFIDVASNKRININKIFAITLKQTNNNIPGWKRTYNFLQKHPEIKIHYGDDGTGNIYNLENQKSFIKLCDTQKVNLFTGDGGFDFSIDYEHQEKSIFLLIVASSIIGLQVLQEDGIFILKIFDLFSESTQFVIRLITLCFKEWTIYKPATSRLCNSERYLICLGFKKTNIVNVVLECLLKVQSSTTYPRPGYLTFFNEKEKEFLDNHIKNYMKNQISILKKTIELQNVTDYSWKEQYTNAYEWCKKFHIPINQSKTIN